MKSSADTLLEACEKFVWDGTDIQYTRIRNIGQKFEGVNDNLAQACYKTDDVFDKVNVELMNIIEDIKRNVRNFAESTKINEQQSVNILNQVNAQSDAILNDLDLEDNI